MFTERSDFQGGEVQETPIWGGIAKKWEAWTVRWEMGACRKIDGGVFEGRGGGC